MAFGSSLRFWSEVAKFSFELITRQCFVPTMQETRQNGATVYRAAWEVVLAGDDEERMHLLSTVMPSVCLAFLPSGEKNREGKSHVEAAVAQRSSSEQRKVSRL